MPSYCSWCMSECGAPTLVRKRVFARHKYQCANGNCGRVIVRCRAPACENYARWDRFSKKVDGKDVGVYHFHQFCGEHGGHVASFATLTDCLAEPSDWQRIYHPRKTNFVKLGKISLFVVVGMSLAVPLAYVAAPAIGGAVGSAILGLRGVAALYAGLAFFGGGAVAAGGFGMVGGTAVLTALGAGVGGAAGAYLGNAYLGNVAGFNVRKLRTGRYPAIVTVNGWLTDGDDSLADWQHIINRHYPRHAWYHVDWEAKKLHQLGRYLAGGLTFRAFQRLVSQAALKASKAAVPVFGQAATAAQCLALANSPWHVAFVKAGMTGVILGDILRRCKDQSFILMGHSLGARVIYAALTTLSTTTIPIVEEAHLMGGAVDNNPDDWKQAAKAMDGNIHNYYSINDRVLKTLYKAGTFFMSTPIGSEPIAINEVDNHEVSQFVDGHTKYKQAAREFLCQTPKRAYVRVPCSDPSCGGISAVWVDEAHDSAVCRKCGKRLDIV